MKDRAKEYARTYSGSIGISAEDMNLLLDKLDQKMDKDTETKI